MKSKISLTPCFSGVGTAREMWKPFQRFFSVAITIFLLPPHSIPAATNDLSTSLQKGLFEEEANHNLPAAIQAYQSIVSELDEARQLAATAVFRLGECYRKQGKTNEALAQYERIVRDFSDQSTLLTLSRQNLVGLGQTAPATRGERPLSTAAAAAEAQRVELDTQIAQFKKLPAEQLSTALQQNFPDALLESLMQKLAAEEQNVAVLRQRYGLTHPEVKESNARIEALHNQIDVDVAAILSGLEIKRDAAARTAKSLQADSGATPSTGQELPMGFPASATSSETDEIKRIQAMIKDSPDLINASDPEGGQTPLHKAAYKGQLAVAKFLLENGANIEARNPRYLNYTPLLQAVASGHKAMVELLFSQKANIQAADSGGNTPLHVAVQEGYKNVVEVLLAHDANVNARNHDAATSLLLAAANGWDAIAELLVHHQADVNSGSPQFNASRRAGGFNRQFSGTPLHVAATLGDRSLAALLLTNKANVNARNSAAETPLHAAASGGYTSTLELLLAHQADINAKNQNGATPLVNAMVQKQWDAAKFLVTNKAELNFVCNPYINGNQQYGLYPIHIAMLMADDDFLEFLLKNGADPDARIIGNENTALHLATENKSKERVELLLKYKANPNLRNRDQLTPLLLAVRNQEPEVVELLLAHGADPNEKGQDGNAPLFNAASSGQKEIVEALLAHKADPNVRANTGYTPGYTPLHIAVAAGRKDLVELLLANGADPNLTDNQGRTPLVLTKPSGPVPPSFTAVPGYYPGVPAPLPAVPTRRLPGGATSAPEQRATPAEINELLLQHGALEAPPDPSSIRIARKGSLPPTTVFTSDTNSFNRFTLMEAVENYYSGAGPPSPFRAPGAAFNGALPFPDFSKITIQRPGHTKPAKQQEIAVNLLNASRSLDCAKDVPFEFGDVVDVPEREHNLAEQPIGLTDAQKQELQRCLERKVTFVVKGQPTEVTLGGLPETTYLSSALRLEPVKKVLRSSSDLSRLELIRGVPSGKPLKVAVQPKAGPDDLWLRNGDAIEVPDKP